MEEKSLIVSENIYKKRKKVFILLIAIMFATTAIIGVGYSIVTQEYREASDRYFNGKTSYGTRAELREKWESALKLRDLFFDLLAIGGVLFIIGIILLLRYLYASKMKITVTDKRVYGNAAFGRRVDLPLDSISAISTSAFKGLSVSTASGRIKFIGLVNRNEIHETISKLLMERQNKSKTEGTTIKQEIQQSNADELKKYKDLLDSGIITQDEFDAKKKQLLGL